MARKSKMSCWLEYAALRVACAIVNAIPYRMACSTARGMAALLVDVFHFKRKRTFKRIRKTFPEKTPSEIAAIARFSLANVLQNAIEMIRAPRLTKEWIATHVKDISVYAERLREILAEGKDGILDDDEKRNLQSTRNAFGHNTYDVDLPNVFEGKEEKMKIPEVANGIKDKIEKQTEELKKSLKK